MTTRRQFMRTSAAVLAGGSILSMTRAARAARGEESFYEWTEVAPSLWTALNRTGWDMNLVGGNSLLCLGAGGGLLVDTKQAVLGPTLLREAKARAGGIALCVNTHHHFDHAGGNHALTAAGIPITAHTKACDRLKASAEGNLAQVDGKCKALAALTLPGADAAAKDAAAFRDGLAGVKPTAWTPTRCIDGNTTLDIAGRKVELRFFGGGHTDNDLVVHFADANVVVTGDLVFNGAHAYYDASATANTVRWQASLRETLKLCNPKTVVVPGHGPVGTAACITAQIEYFDRMRDYVSAALKAGKPREDIIKMDPPEAYKDHGLRIALGYLLGGIVDELKPAAPATPAATTKG